MSNNIRTISQLQDLNNGSFTFEDLSSANLFIEVSKNDNINNNVQTYKLSMAKFLELLIGKIHTSGNGWWVTTSGNDIQEISSPKKFNENVYFGDNATIKINNNVATISCNNTIIEGTARRAHWA